MTEFPEFPIRAFAKADPSPDPLFYAAPRFVLTFLAGPVGLLLFLVLRGKWRPLA